MEKAASFHRDVCEDSLELENTTVARFSAHHLVPHAHHAEVWRRLRPKGSISGQRGESKGTAQHQAHLRHDHSTVVFGDGGSGEPMRHHAPVKKQGDRKLLVKNGIQCYLADEYRTTKRRTRWTEAADKRTDRVR